VPRPDDQPSGVSVLTAIHDHGRAWADQLLYEYSMAVVSAAIDREIADGTLTPELVLTAKGEALVAEAKLPKLS
jgi:hypothetical protein